MQDWPYAILAKEASLNGGPERFLDTVREAGVAEGRIQGGLVTAAITIALSAVGFWQYRKKLQAVAEEAASVHAESHANEAAGEADVEPGNEDPQE